MNHHAYSPQVHPFTLSMQRAIRSHADAKQAIVVVEASGHTIGHDEKESSWRQSAKEWLNFTQAKIFEVTNAPANYFRRQIDASLRTAGTLLQDGAAGANKTVANAVERTAKSLQDAMTSLGTGAGSAFRGFWGVPPWVLLAGGVLALGAVAAGGGMLFLSPGGQALGISAAKTGAAMGTSAAQAGGALAKVLL